VNVVGVSLPGAPNVIIGFNQNIAWGVTNVAPDVWDYYKITFKDASRKEYLYNGEYKPVTYRVDTFYVRDKGFILDTLELTHYGPIVDSKGENFHPECPKDHALRWLAHDPSQELLTFYYLNRAKKLEDYRNALKYYTCPAQNFIFASKNKDIALTSNGKYPLKWKGQGKFTLDGSNPQHEWQGWVPFEHNPYTLNPPHDYIASANQFPTDTTYPYFLHWEFASFERGKRIHDRLKNLYNANVDSLRLLQLDNKNMFAEFALPAMLNYLDEQQIQQKKWKYSLERWNYFHEPQQVEPTLFIEWYKEFEKLVWDECVVVQQKDTI
jgi:penicillin amidase